MLYTVKEISVMANVTVKTLHHYHKIGILVPCEISKAGYRLYGQKELERLQQILFYRELDFSLKDISEALEEDSNRVRALSRQRRLLCARLKRIELLIKTLDDSISHSERNEMMTYADLFKGFTAEEWKEALEEQSDYLKEKFGYDLQADNSIQAEEMNVMARESIKFQSEMAEALRGGVYCRDDAVKKLLSEHLKFLNEHGTSLDVNAFVQQIRFLTGDEFHRKMFENQQTGLSYYLLCAVEAFAANAG
ncbi:MAG: MerR family transcriptional regulator [Anaerolineae bacterium]|nr:MerR family transcriptional regulator [Anaerolineae bacterium]